MYLELFQDSLVLFLNCEVKMSISLVLYFLDRFRRKVLVILTKYLFIVSAISLSLCIILSLSTNVILLDIPPLSLKYGLISFQNVLLSESFFSFTFLKKFRFVFLNRFTQKLLNKLRSEDLLHIKWLLIKKCNLKKLTDF